MKTINQLIGSLVLIHTLTASAAEPVLLFEINGDAKSYTFTTENPGTEKVSCHKIEVQADARDEACSEIIETYKYVLSDTSFPAGTKITNTSFGIDFLHSLIKKSKGKTRIFCDQPQIYLDCK